MKITRKTRYVIPTAHPLGIEPDDPCLEPPYDDVMLTANEAAFHFALSPRKLARMRKQGVSPPYFKGKGPNGAVAYPESVIAGYQPFARACNLLGLY